MGALARRPVGATAARLRLAATTMLVRDRDELEVLMVLRHHELDFVSGALVFPGGAIDDADAAIAAGTAGPSGQVDALALRVGGVREVFEETGLLLARSVGSEHLIDIDQVAAIESKYRKAMHARTISFADMLAAERLALATDLLVPFAHWVTPEAMPKRFDTHFFLAAVSADHVVSHDGHETVDATWIAPQRALAEAKAGRLSIVPPTRANLQMLGGALTTADAMREARARSIVTVVPEITLDALGKPLRIRIDPSAGYEETIFDI